MLFCRTVGSNFIDYYENKRDFSFSFYGLDGLAVERNKPERERMSFHRLPGRLIGEGKEVFDLDYLWMTPEDVMTGLVFVDAERRISFWGHLRTDRLD